jgi:Ca-activated chloride channel family protein
MSFGKPQYLYLLILVPGAVAFLVWAARRRRAALGRFASAPLGSALSPNVGWRQRRWKAVLWFVSLISLVLGLAQPRWGTQILVRAREGVEVMVVLDVSASMLSEDIKPSRLDRAKLTIEELMDRLAGNDLGLVVFSGAAFVQIPITSDFYTLRAFLDGVGPASVSRPGTSLSEGIRVALRGFAENRSTTRVIVLLSDGEGHEGDPLTAAEDAARQEVTIHAIGFGSPEGEPIPIRDAGGTVLGYRKDARGNPVLSRLDEGTLRQIAGKTGGLYARATATGEEIEVVVERIGALQTGEREGQFETHGVERLAWFSGAAFLSLAVETVLSGRRRHA